MKKDIYNLLNDVSTDTSAYPEETLTEAELQKYRANLRKRIGKRRHRGIYTVLAMAACAALVIGAICLRPMKEWLRASTNKKANTLSAMLGVEPEQEEYTMYLNETKRIDGGSISLNAVAVDEGQMVVYTTQTFEGEEKIPRYSDGNWGRNYKAAFETTGRNTSLFKRVPDGKKPYNFDWEVIEGGVLVQKLYVNGEEFRCDVTGENNASENGVLQDIAWYNFPEGALPFPADIRIEFYKDAGDPKPETSFTFTLTEEMLVPKMKEVEINQILRLPDGQEVKVTKFVYNALGTRIYAEYAEDRWDADYKVLCFQSEQKKGYPCTFYDEYPIAATQSVFKNDRYATCGQIPELKEWIFDVDVLYYNYKEKKTDIMRMEEKLVIPLE